MNFKIEAQTVKRKTKKLKSITNSIIGAVSSEAYMVGK